MDGGGAADNVYEGARTYIFGECGDFVGWAVMLQARVTTAVDGPVNSRQSGFTSARIACGNVVTGPTFRKCVARSNEGWVAEVLVPLRSRAFGVRRTCDLACDLALRRGDVTYGGRYALLPYAASRFIAGAK